MSVRLPPGIVPVVPGPGQESVWDYPRPPRLEPVATRIRAVVDGHVLADSTRALRVLETSHPPVYYLPPDDVDLRRLVVSARSTVCEWKGGATYLDYVAGGRRIPTIAWMYRDPEPQFAALRDHLAFYAGRLDEAWVGDERATPQAGAFYGGWITPSIVGPIKGEPGSFGW
jgi:uncharacterized protein (DUF427 family)